MTRPPDGEARRVFGLVPAIVTDIVDPQSTGRIQVSFPWLGNDGSSARAWARLVTPYADDDQGFEILPSVDTEVIVAFEHGDLTRPYIIGACWNGKESLPESAEQPNNKRLLKTRSGSLLEFDDTDGAAKVTLSMKSGHKVVLDDSAEQITIAHAMGCTITMDATNVSIQANVSCKITAPMLEVDAPISTFSGIVECQTLIADSGVVSPSYTPGAGNIW